MTKPFGTFIEHKSYSTVQEWLDAPCKDGSVTVAERLCFLAHAGGALRPTLWPIIDTYPNGHQRGLTVEEFEELDTLVNFMDRSLGAMREFQKRLANYSAMQLQACTEALNRQVTRQEALQRVTERMSTLTDEEFHKRLATYSGDAVALAFKGAEDAAS